MQAGRLALQDINRTPLKMRLICGAVISGAVLLALMIFQVATDSASKSASENDALFSGLAVLGGVLLGAWHGPLITNARKTHSLIEACIRVELILGEVILFTLVGRQLVIGVSELFGNDPLGGAMKILMVIPFGPITALLAFLYTFWSTIPPALVCGALLFYGFNSEARRQRLNSRGKRP